MRREGGGGWAREALIIVLGVVVVVLSALFPGYKGWAVRGLALGAVAVAVAVMRWLERPVGARSAEAGPESTRSPHSSVPPGRSSVEMAACVVTAQCGRRTSTGIGTLVADGRVVTSARVVEGADQVTVRFAHEAGRAELSVQRLELDHDAPPGLVLLGVDVAAQTPPPPDLWPARRLPGDVDALVAVSVWRGARIVGAVEGASRLEWEVGDPLLGSGGGPVCDRETGRLVGVLADDPQTGRLDRLIPVHDLRRAGVGLARPWLLTGDSARAHFSQRASGQRSVLRGGDLFRGRVRALEVVDTWMRTDVCPGVPLVVTGQPGAGKSTVVGQALLRAERAGHSDGLGVHARQVTVGDFVNALAAACGLDAAGSWRDLAQELVRLTPPSVLVVVVDALDEAVGSDIAELRQVLRDVARLDWVRVVVATRPLARGDPYRPGGHLHALGVARGAASRNLVDLDDDRFHAPGELRGYAADQLAQEGVAHPGPPGAAWETYRRDAELRDRLAAVVAERAGRNYLVAGMSAFQLAEDDAVVDPAWPGFDPAVVPRGVGEALTKHLDNLPRRWRCRVEDLLTALAYGRGAGLDDQRWLIFAAVLGRDSATADDLERLRASAAADYLLETTLDETGDPVTRLFHQALADELLDRRSCPADERRLLTSLRAESRSGSWLDVSPYARRHAPSHAQVAGCLRDLLTEADFLVGMDPDGMRPALNGVPARSRTDPASIYDVALPFLSQDPDGQGVNAAVLEFVSRTQGNAALADRLGDLGVERPWRAGGRIRAFDTHLARFEGHTAGVVGAAGLAWPGLDHPVVVTTSHDGTARVWDPRRPDTELARFDRHTDRVHGVATLAWPGLDHPAVVTTSDDGTARVWDPRRPDIELARFEGHDGPVYGVATLDWPGLDHPVVVTTSADATARVWDPLQADCVLACFDGHSDIVGAVTTLAWPGVGHPVVVTTSLDWTARVWDPLLPDLELARFEGHISFVGGAASIVWPGIDHPVVVTAACDWSARVWDPQLPDVELARFDGHCNWVTGVVSIPWPGIDHPVVATASVDGTARVWDPLRPGEELARFDGHTGPLVGIATLPWPGLDHPALVTTSLDGTARVWDPLSPDAGLARLDGHIDEVWDMAPLEWPGLDHPVLVAGSLDATARVWDPYRPHVDLARFDRHTDAVSCAASLDWPGLDHPVVVTGSLDGTARIWDPRRPDGELARIQGHPDTDHQTPGVIADVAALTWPGLDHPAVVTTSNDRTARVWDPLQPGHELACFGGHTDRVVGVHSLDWPGLDHPAVVTTSADGTARVWDPLRPSEELARFDRHTDWVWKSASLDWPGLDHSVVVTTSFDGTARIWDPQQPHRELACFDGHTDRVWGVATLEWPGLDHPVVVTTSVDGTARVWDPLRPDRGLARLPVFGMGCKVVVIGPGHLAVGTNRGCVTLQIRSPGALADAGSDAGRDPSIQRVATTRTTNG